MNLIESRQYSQPIVSLVDCRHQNSDKTQQTQRPLAALGGIRVSVARRQRSDRRDVSSPKEAFAFLGIPFGEVPERFAKPQPFGRLWTGLRQATHFGAVCPQDLRLTNRFYRPFELKPDEMSEDCLFLNVWTPTLDSSAKLPVMVWIYGGYYKIGASNYFDGTAYAALHNTVFVSFNYRVGIYGFLHTGNGDGDVRGNMGLLDQREALRWVKKHVACFGGDPDNVTLFGNSAGAASVCFHMLSQGSRGLFQRAIVQSGQMFGYRSAITSSEAHRRLKQFLASKGVPRDSNNGDFVRYLKSLPAEQLIDDSGPDFLFQPVIDDIELPVHPVELVRRYGNGRLATDIDLMVGFCTDEGFVNARAAAQRQLQCLDGMTDEPTESRRQQVTSCRTMAREIIEKNILSRTYAGHPNLKSLSQSVWNEYNWLAGDCDDHKQMLKCLSEVFGDMLYVYPSTYAASLHSESAETHRKTYFFRFDHRPSSSSLPDWVVATHGQEIPFTIGIPFLDRQSNDSWSDEDLNVCELTMRMWSNFAKNGNPNNVMQEGNADFHWPTYDVTRRYHAIIRARPSIGRDYRRQRVDFWQNVVEQLVLNGSTHQQQQQQQQHSQPLVSKL